jgi:methyl coenzyme M reductase subunit D
VSFEPYENSFSWWLSYISWKTVEILDINIFPSRALMAFKLGLHNIEKFINELDNISSMEGVKC